MLMTRPTRWAVATALAAGAIVAVTGAPATAAPGSGAARPGYLPVGAVAGASPRTVVYDSFGAGYVVATTRIARATTSFTAPPFSCASTQDDEELFAGLFVLDSQNVIYQLVTAEYQCHQGIVTEYAAVCFYADSYKCNVGNVSPGDRVTASITDTGDRFTGSLVNHTSGQTVALSGQPSAVYPRILVGDAGPGPVPTFSPIDFTGSSVNGRTIGTSRHTRYNLEDNAEVEIATSPLAANGSDFTLTFRRNY